MKQFNLTDTSQLPELIELLQQAAMTGETVVEWRRRTKKRTGLQNNSLHKYCEIMAAKMNDAGISRRDLIIKLKKGFELPVKPDDIKDIFRKVGRVLCKKESTAELLTTEIQEVYLIVDKRLSEITGVQSEWPSSQPPMMRDYD